VIRVVGIDVSTWWGGLALVEASDAGVAPLLVAEVGLLVRDSHAVHLLVLLDRLLAEASWSNSSVDAYAATRGPGAFTGLRVGLGTIRGLGLASGRPGIGVGTLRRLRIARGDLQFSIRGQPQAIPAYCEADSIWIGFDSATIGCDMPAALTWATNMMMPGRSAVSGISNSRRSPGPMSPMLLKRISRCPTIWNAPGGRICAWLGVVSSGN